MIEETLQKFIEFLRTASPHVWEVLVRQAYVDGLGYLIMGLGVAVGVWLGLRLVRYSKEEFDGEGEFWGWIMTVLTGVTSLGMVTSAIQRFINPEFYAIRYIIEQITGK